MARLAEGFPAAASGFGIGVSNFKPLAGQAIVEMDLGSPKVIETVSVHGIFDTGTLAHLIGWLGSFQGHSVFETRTTTGFDKNAQEISRGRSGSHFLDLCQGRIGEFDHPIKVTRKASQVNEFVLQLYLCQKRKKHDIYQIFS